MVPIKQPPVGRTERRIGRRHTAAAGMACRKCPAQGAAPRTQAGGREGGKAWLKGGALPCREPDRDAPPLQVGQRSLWVSILNRQPTKHVHAWSHSEQEPCASP